LQLQAENVAIEKTSEFAADALLTSGHRGKKVKESFQEKEKENFRRPLTAVGHS
jgi:hypothetical protein